MLQVPVLCRLTDKTCSTETEIWRLEEDHSPAHHDSSPFPFLQPSTLYDCGLKPPPPRRSSREAGLCSAHNFKVHSPLLFFLSTSCIPLFLYLYSHSSLHCSINIFPLYCFFSVFLRPLSLSASYPSRASFSHPLPLLMCIPPAQRHQKACLPPLVL